MRGRSGFVLAVAAVAAAQFREPPPQPGPGAPAFIRAAIDPHTVIYRHPPGGSIQYGSWSVEKLVAAAYDVPFFRVTGKAGALQKLYDLYLPLPPGTAKAEELGQFQQLLAQRIRTHRESRGVKVYALEARSGPSKLHPSTGVEAEPLPADRPQDTTQPGVPPRGRVRLNIQGENGEYLINIVGRQAPVSDLVQRLVDFAHLPIVDQSGLTGTYDFTLDFRSKHPGPGWTSGALFPALQHQLGLELVNKVMQLDVVVVDDAK
jgi:uncharacterized protein (TIGR03435 family)